MRSSLGSLKPRGAKSRSFMSFLMVKPKHLENCSEEAALGPSE